MNTEMVHMMENVASTLEGIRKDMGTVEDVMKLNDRLQALDDHVNVRILIVDNV